MTTTGIDIGGTKIESQLFDGNWNAVARHRTPTPADYGALVQAVADHIAWADARAGGPVPVGIGAAGLVNPRTGLALTANLVATGHPFPADITAAVGRDIVYMNDCRALALSEAVFGAGRSCRTVMALILGTGVGGGMTVDQTLLRGPTRTGGEFGHMSAPAHVIAKYDLPLYPCGCGRSGCIETYIAGPALSRLAKQVTGADLAPPQIAALRATDMALVWTIWCDLVADLVLRLTLTADPDVIVIGGGLSQIDGLLDNLGQAAQTMQIGDFAVPPLAIAQGGDSSGARGAAYAAWQAQSNA